MRYPILPFACISLIACGSASGGPVAGAADTHCDGVAPVVVDDSPAVCGSNTTPISTGAASSDYGPTHDGTVADDDDCKYHVSWSSTPIKENTNVTFTVDASVLAAPGGPLTGLNTNTAYAEVFLSDTHPAPPTAQVITEATPGVVTFGPIQFDEKGIWTVRFHLREDCADDNPASPHGHAAFYVEVP